MVKEMFQNIMSNSGEWMNGNRGQLQLAGMSALEQRALMDVLNAKDELTENPMRLVLWG